MTRGPWLAKAETTVAVEFGRHMPETTGEHFAYLENGGHEYYRGNGEDGDE